jgi:hypothetical protein
MTMFSAGEWIALERTALLVFPALAAAVLLMRHRPTPREATAAMVAGLWQLPALLLLQLLTTEFGWWRFAPGARQILGLPADVWIGWALWWGPVAAFLAMRFSWRIVIVAMIAIDLAAMPLLTPLVVVADHWWIGEAVAVALCLAPGLAAAELTRRDRAPESRTTLHAFGWGGYMLLLLPAIGLAVESRGLDVLYRLPASFGDGVLVLAIALLLFLGIAAAQEFAEVGRGTPIPFDPPKRVVTTGIYAFIANPMQVISAAVMAGLAAYAESWTLALVAANFVIFDSIYAAWYNRVHIARAMPAEWTRYTGAVPHWWIRWKPYVDSPATLETGTRGLTAALSRRCGAKGPACGLGFVFTPTRFDAPKRPVYRRAASGIEAEGVIAVGRALEHGNLATAALGWLLRFPVVSPILDRAAALLLAAWSRARVAVAALLFAARKNG